MGWIDGAQATLTTAAVEAPDILKEPSPAHPVTFRSLPASYPDNPLWPRGKSWKGRGARRPVVE